MSPTESVFAWLSLATGAILGLFTYVLFVVALGIELYPGVLFDNP